VSAAAPDSGDDRMERARTAFAVIGAQALRSNLARLDDLDGFYRAGLAGRLTESDRATASGVAHQLVGSAGTFGYERVSRLARQVESFFLSRGPGQDFVAPGAETPVEACGEWLRQAHDGLVAGPDQPED
jgi:HPt (histidine-containing phosphotransfer) domain-containing protein